MSQLKNKRKIKLNFDFLKVISVLILITIIFLTTPLILSINKLNISANIPIYLKISLKCFQMELS